MNNTVQISNKFNTLTHNFHTPPKGDTPISIDSNGNIISYFKDNIWDCSNYAYIYAKQSKIDFNIESNSQNKDLIIYQIKLVLFYLMFSRKRRDSNITIASIYNNFSIIRKIAYLCLNFNCHFNNLKHNNLLLKNLKKFIFDLSGESQKRYIGIFNAINKAGFLYNINDFGFDVKFIESLKTPQNTKIIKNKQTLLIPTRIYAEFINSGLNFFEEFHPVVDNLINFFNDEECFKYKFSNNFRQKSKSFLKLKQKYNLEDFFQKYDLKFNQKIVFFMQAIQSLGGLLIICFSGMRRSEALNLNYQSYQEIVRKNLPSAWILKGTTSKYTQVGSVATSWVTSSVLNKVFSSLQGLARIHKVWCIHYAQPNNLDINQYPLFPSFSYKHEKSFHPVFQMPLGGIVENHIETIYRIIHPIIFTEDDLQELMIFNPLINWLEDYKIEIGKPWKFLPHQFRRSLTVYCARSGLVKIPTLKRQLKHISFDMTLYYGKNYMHAKNFVQDYNPTDIQYEAGLVKEYKNQTLYEQLSDFTKNVIEKNTPLFGGEGTRLQVLKDQNQAPSFFTDKKQTEKYIFEGKIAYKKTVLGGCSRVSGCNKLGFSYVTACIPCSYSIFNEDSIDALELARESYAQIAQAKLDANQPLLFAQYMQEVKAVDQLLAKLRKNYIEVKNV